MITEPYLTQIKRWPKNGRHILARFDDESIYVYQAYRPSIAQYAVENQRFGGEFSLARMSWIKPNFLWMMYRSGWGTKEGQEKILAIRLHRNFFDHVLQEAVPSTFDSNRYSSQSEWKTAVANSDVRLQWDPDHDPSGAVTERRAVQLGLRGETLRKYSESALISIEDISSFVEEQRSKLTQNYDSLLMPKESIYIPNSREAAMAIGIDFVT